MWLPLIVAGRESVTAVADLVTVTCEAVPCRAAVLGML